MSKARQMALGGVLAALAVVVMSMGTLIPGATYLCPMLCTLMMACVCRICGRRVGGTWYGAVFLLSLLLCPDKEAAAVFGAFGYYPLIKKKIDSTAMKWLWKGLFFNAASAFLYLLLIYVFAMEYLIAEFMEFGWIGLAVTAVLGNVCFFLLDRVLSRFSIPQRGR